MRTLRERMLGLHRKPLDFGTLAQHQDLFAERVLLEGAEEALCVLSRFSSRDQELLGEVLQTITSGQELDLIHFAGASTEKIIALETDAELDDYTYRVAGCVGEFWTKMCRAHLFPKAPLDDARLLTDSVRLGKGLQLVNIMRDIPEDLRQGRCCVPLEKLNAAGLKPANLLQSETEPQFRPTYNSYLELASAYLAAGWDYTNALPRSCVRVRLACAWPILIGVRTLARLRVQNVLDASQRIKVSRPEVRNLLVWSVLLYPLPALWRRLFAHASSGVARRSS